MGLAPPLTAVAFESESSGLIWAEAGVRAAAMFDDGTTMRVLSKSTNLALRHDGHDGGILLYKYVEVVLSKW